MCFLSKMDAEHRLSRSLVRKRNIDSLLETPTNGGIQLPWLSFIAFCHSYHIRRSQHQHARLVISHTIHLHQELVESLALATAAIPSLSVIDTAKHYIT